MVYKNFLTLISILIFCGNSFALPFNDDLVGTQPKTGQLMRPEPEGSVPVGADTRYVESEAAALKLTIPATENLAISLKRGERMYRTNCLQCHGIWKGDKYIAGSVQQWLPGLDLTMQMIADKPDGHFFSAIHYGFAGIMPPYGYKFSIDEHWDLVRFVRKMQEDKKSGGQK